MISALQSLFLPYCCNLCKSKLQIQENVLCLYCIHKIPLANSGRISLKQPKEILYGRVQVENSKSLFIFKKGNTTQKLLHELKYRNCPNISTFLGKWMGNLLLNDPNFNKIDMVIPVPLHQSRFRKRGYNQVSGFGKQIAQKLQIPFREDILIKVKKSKSLVHQNRLKRWMNAQEAFHLNKPKSILKKHILLVDDLITTGATVEACTQEFTKGCFSKLSIATMAIA